MRYSLATAIALCLLFCTIVFAADNVCVGAGRGTSDAPPHGAPANSSAPTSAPAPISSVRAQHAVPVQVPPATHVTKAPKLAGKVKADRKKLVAMAAAKNHKLKKKAKVSDVYGDALYGKLGPIGVMADSPPFAPQLPWKRGELAAQNNPQLGQAFAQNNPHPQRLKPGAQSTVLQGGAQGASIQAKVEEESGPINILFLVDSSQSMKEGLGGGIPKMEAAKQVLQKAMSQIPGDVNVGLRVFGQKFTGDVMVDCQQSALLVPIGTGNRRSVIEQVRQMKPYGMTPLTWALMQSGRDLRNMPGPKTLILISDGAETCGGEPCSYIARLNEMGIKLRVDIVGLGLKRDREAREQLNCIANASGGKYYDANSAEELIDSVSHSVTKAIEGRIITKMKPGTTTVTPPEVEPAEPEPQPNH